MSKALRFPVHTYICELSRVQNTFDLSEDWKKASAYTPRETFCWSNLFSSDIGLCTSFSHSTSASSSSLTEIIWSEGWEFLMFLTFSFNLVMNLLTYTVTRNSFLLLLNRCSPKHSLKHDFDSVMRFAVVIEASFLHCTRQGMGWAFDMFQKFAVKFPAHGQIIPVNCNQISRPRAAHCCPSQGWTQERYNKNISK